MHPLAVVLLHLGKLHPFEHALVWLLAFGPFVVLFFAVRVARRRAALEEAADPNREPAEQRD